MDLSEDKKRSSESTTPPGSQKEFSGGAKRQKITLSCNECRRRKIKCDHGKPVCQNCVKRGSGTDCTYARSPWIDIIAAESKVYQEIDVLKKENDDLMDAVASIKSELILVYKKNHNNITSSDDDILSTGNVGFLLDDIDTHEISGSLYSSAVRGRSADTPLATNGHREGSNGEDGKNFKLTKYEYHFLKDTTEIPLRNRVKRILSTDASLIEMQSYHDVEVPRAPTTLRCGNDGFYKNYYLNQLISVLPPVDVMQFHISYYFKSNYHKHMPVLSEPMLHASFNRLFTTSPGRITLDPTRELEDFVELFIILIVLKISSLYRETTLNDQNNVILRNAYVAFELGEVKIRASITTLQALLLITSFRLFSHKVSDFELFFSTELCRDMAIALGIHKNTEIIYEHKSREEKQVLQAIKVMLNRGW